MPNAADVILTTLNARYAHAAFGLRYLLANLPVGVRERAAILEFDINQRPIDVLESILACHPRIVGVGVYIWNAAQSLQLVADLKRLRPDVIVILGGPEVSYETDRQEIVSLADYVVTGEADFEFGQLCEVLLSGRERPAEKVVAAELPDVVKLKSPYELYDDRDVAHRVIYVEASRGCPFRCEFCLSSLDVPVRNFPLEPFFSEIGKLFARGVRQFKFVDRTFNLNVNIGRSILEFFLERYEPGLFVHFEMIPDRLPDALREPIKRFPAGALQFEVGIQTFNENVAQRISRRQDNAKVADNLRFLRDQTGVHVHADLIAGLPGEDLASFGAGFDRLLALGPQEIQVGILKRLRGTPIVRHDVEWGMVYSPHAPYEILQTKNVDFATMQRLRRFSRCWDLIANSGHFAETTPIIWERGSPFEAMWGLSERMFGHFGRTSSIALHHLAEFLFDDLVSQCGRDASRVASAMWRDHQRGGRVDCPDYLRDHIPASERQTRPAARDLARPAPPRQSRHLI